MNYLTRISFETECYWTNAEHNYEMLNYILFHPILYKYEGYHCSRRSEGTAFIDYWACYRWVDESDLKIVCDEIYALGIPCKVEVCDSRKLKYKTFYEF